MLNFSKVIFGYESMVFIADYFAYDENRAGKLLKICLYLSGWECFFSHALFIHNMLVFLSGTEQN